MAQLESRKLDVPAHPLVADTAARAVLRTILDAEILGIALLRGPPWEHVMVNGEYERLTGSRCALGRSLDDVLGGAAPSTAFLDGLLRHGRPVRVPEVRVDPAEAGVAPGFVAFTYLRASEPETSAIVVLVEDVTHEARRRHGASLLSTLAEAAAEEDSVAGIRTTLERTASAIGADASSFFVLDGAQRHFHGAVGWDRVRSGFVASLDAWPTVAVALECGRGTVLTRGEAKRGELPWFDAFGLATTLCVPVCVGARSIGVLFFDFCKIRTFDIIALELVTEIADRCGRTVARAAEASLHRGDTDDPS